MWARSSRVAWLATKVAGHEVRHKMKRALGGVASLEEATATRIAQARLMVESLGRMKGALMKAGQMLSIDASDWLPKEAQDILTSLQGESAPVPFETLKGVIEEDLGKDALLRFDAFHEAPVASASMGQVYRARRGEELAVKVQYPGVSESIDSDVEALEKLGAGMMTLSGRRIDLKELFGELKRVLHDEADYERERRYLETFREKLHGDPLFIVPQSHADLSSRRVLTTSWEAGTPLGVWLRAAPAERAVEVATQLLDLYCREFFEWGLVQTDPNPANFLVRDDGRIVLLDFGATVEYSAEFRSAYGSLLRTVQSAADEEVIERGIAFELIDGRESDEAKALFVDMLRVSVAPFSTTQQPFRFRDTDYNARSREATTDFIRSLKYSAPPKHLVFLHRKLGGLFQLLKRVDATLDLRPYWERMVGLV